MFLTCKWYLIFYGSPFTGYYQSNSGQPTCDLCTSASYCDPFELNNVTGIIQPVDCPPGYYCPQNTEYALQNPCPPGTFSNRSQLALEGRQLFLLTHLPLDKMATIVADNIFKCIFLNENDRIPIQIWLKFVPRSPVLQTGDFHSDCQSSSSMTKTNSLSKYACHRYLKFTPRKYNNFSVLHLVIYHGC